MGSNTAAPPTAKNGQINSVPTAAEVPSTAASRNTTLTGKGIGVGRHKIAVQPVLYLAQESCKEKQHRQDGAFHSVFRYACPSGS